MRIRASLWLRASDVDARLPKLCSPFRSRRTDRSRRRADLATKPPMPRALLVAAACSIGALAFGCASAEARVAGGDVGAVDADADAETSVADGGADTRVPPAPTVASACAAWAKGECALLAACTPAELARAYAPGTCPARLELLCRARAAAPGVGAAFATSIQSCAAIRPSCADYRLGLRDRSCTPSGTFPVGSTCAIDEQCAAGLLCSTSDGGPPPCQGGVCLPAGSAGDVCRAVGTARFACSPGTFCPIGGTRCVAYAREADRCGTGVGDGTCSQITNCGAAGLCEPLYGEAFPCDPGVVGACDPEDSLYCDATSARCARMTSAAPGEPCDARTRCTGGSRCDGAVCTPLPGDGADCSATGECLAPARCDPTSRTCVLPDYFVCR
jgi:hypothetical protein